MGKLLPFVIEYWYWATLLAVLLLAYFYVEFRTRNFGVPEITTQTAILLANREKAKWIDVRPEASFKKSHIADAVNFNTSAFDKSEIGLKRFQKTPLIIVCERGMSAKPIAAKLKKLGYNVNVLEGGMGAWRKAELPVVAN